jgi:RNA polymerase sigma factor (sigma-70 family)
VAGPTADETRLTAAMLSGDAAAFGRLVAQCQASVRALSRRLAGSAADGDDIAQAAFLVAWRRRADWRGGSFKSWVCTIAYREFLQQRRRGGRVDIVDPEVLEAQAPGAPDATSERVDLQRALASLEPGERDAIALCLGAGLSHSEAASAMGAPLGTVKSWVARGRQKLQTMLSAYDAA